MPSLPVVLLVEDNLGDIELTRDALERTGLPHDLLVTRDGAEAMAFIRQEARYRDAPRPSLILLDLNLPKKDGREVLREIKSDPRLTRIPVVVYTSSDAEEEVRNCYNLHANAYVTKALRMMDSEETLRALMSFWIGHARLCQS